MSRACESSLSFGVGLLMGVVAGVVAGILLTPKSGEEIRNDLKDTVESIASKNKKLDNCKSASADILNKVKYTLEKQIINLNEAVRAGKMAAAKHREELETGYKY